MRHRVFVAITPDEKTLEAIEKPIEECRKDLPPGIGRQIRFLPPENWHITLSFLGYQEEEGLEKIKTSLAKTTQQVEPFSIRLKRLCFGPPNKPPRMIWLVGDNTTSHKLGEIKSRLEDLLEACKIPLNRERRPFNAHITLARFDLLLPRPRPTIEKSMDLRFRIKSLDLMESHLSREGAEYKTLFSAPLAKE